MNAQAQTAIEPLLTVEDVIGLFGISKPPLYRWMNEGDFPRPLKIANTTRWRKCDLDAIIDTRAKAAANADDTLADLIG